ncbi:conserved hypothetical protein [Tenacibaculum litopenaei]|uniref:carboxypeptidase-like regulatory domain-containing protein n=1 Tax=Tenacibaculum litopenaei TaxID=396016 RepID=UPI0038937E80
MPVTFTTKRKIDGSFTIVGSIVIHVLCYCCSLAMTAQTFIGTVKNEGQEPLQNANLIAEVAGGKEIMAFAITDEQGRFRMQLRKGVTYTIRVSFIGYKSTVITHTALSTEKKHHFVLQESGELLDEIVIKANQTPIMVKKDTLIYDVNRFSNGEEFKMIEVLEKLPGIEVEANGTVKVQGKKVSRLLVENKPFFGGSTKLAIENIPANALDKLEVIDHFTEVDFLKKVSDSKEMIINVKLKKDKKRFVFGDVEAGGEVASSKGHYNLNSALFSYSKRRNISFIGGVNTIGKSAFSYEDLRRFENMESAFIDRKRAPESLVNFAVDNKRLLQNKSTLSSLNLNVDLSSSISLNSYAIFSKTHTKSLRSDQVTYLQAAENVFENRSFQNEQRDLVVLGSVKLNYAPSPNSRLMYQSQYKYGSPEGAEQLVSVTNVRDLRVGTDHSQRISNFKQFFEWHVKHGKKHASTLVLTNANTNFSRSKLWQSTMPILPNYLNYTPAAVYEVSQLKSRKGTSVDALLKHYWSVHDLHHLYVSLGSTYEVTRVHTDEYQLLKGGLASAFPEGTFGNRLKNTFSDAYFGVAYKFKLAGADHKLSLSSHLYRVQSVQANTFQYTNTLVEPRWNSEFEFSPSESVELEYAYTNEFPRPDQYLQNFTVVAYNSLFRGNALLTNERFHKGSINYSKRNLYKGMFLRANVSYFKKVKTLRNRVEFDGVDQFVTPVITNNPETSVLCSGLFEKQLFRMKLSVRMRLRWLQYGQELGNSWVVNQRNNQRLTLKLRSSNKKNPAVGFRYTKSFSQFKGLANSDMNADVFGGYLRFKFLRNFVFTSDYEHTTNVNQFGQPNSFQNWNATLLFRKKNKPLSIEISGQNMLNTREIVTNSFSDFMISSSRVSILPRIVMLTLRYKI